MHEGMPMQPGRVEVIAGPMFAGKTEELPRRVRRG
jgi:thymidine kinase